MLKPTAAVSIEEASPCQDEVTNSSRDLRQRRRNQSFFVFTVHTAILLTFLLAAVFFTMSRMTFSYNSVSDNRDSEKDKLNNSQDDDGMTTTTTTNRNDYNMMGSEGRDGSDSSGYGMRMGHHGSTMMGNDNDMTGGDSCGECMNLIHNLFEHHDEINTREVEHDAGTGIVTTTTTSDNPQVGAWLQQHVALMKKQVAQKQPVRHWDPLFAQLVQHADELVTSVENLYADGDEQHKPMGVHVEYKGLSPCGKSLAELHAAVVSRFVSQGWKEAHTKHDASNRCNNTP